MEKSTLTPLSYDTETTGLDYHNPEVYAFAYSTCDMQGKTEVHRFDNPRRKRSRQRLNEIWSDAGILKVMHNAKFDLAFTEKALSRRLDDQPIADTFIASNILQSDHPNHGLKELAWDLGGYPRDDEKKIKGFKNYQDVPEYLMNRYQICDAERTALLWLFFEKHLNAQPLWREAYDEEIKLVRTTLRMEQRGVVISLKRCRKLLEELHQSLTGIAKMAEQITKKRGINLNRPEEIRWILYDFLGAAVEERTPTGLPSTDKEVILALRESHPHPILDLIIKHRSWSRGDSIISGYMESAVPLEKGEELAVLHPNIKTMGAATGRESCSNPNLQNVEKSASFKNPFPVPARKVFRPLPGYINLPVDYAGIELRLLVHYSGDQELVDCINAGQDPHALAAELFFRDRWRNASKDEKKVLRGAAKNANFAIPYGAGAPKVASTLGLPPEDAESVFRAYRERWPNLVNLSRTVSNWVRSDGYVTTSFGRRIIVSRYKPYVGVNYLIQGTAADILKRAQNRLHYQMGVEMILPIHDEIVIQLPRTELPRLQEFMREVRKLMIDFPGVFKVPLDVEFSLITNSWEEKHDIQIKT